MGIKRALSETTGEPCECGAYGEGGVWFDSPWLGVVCTTTNL